MYNFIVVAFISSVLVTGIQCVEIPNCDFFDTVNVTGSYDNGSYKYKDRDVPANLTGEYDYVINTDGDKEPVPKHIRGCVCKLIAPCIRFCCHPKKQMESDNKGCSNYMNESLTYDYLLNISLSDGRTVEKHILKDMIVQEDLHLPCVEHYALDVEENEDDRWTLLENGYLYRHDDQKYLSKQEYCIQPKMSSTGGNYAVLVPFNCIIFPSLTLAYVKLCSIIFMFFTILGYLFLSKFRSLHGRICNLYFICLTLTFLLNVFALFKTFDGQFFCLVNGYAGYFMVMATFMWLSVISFDLWRRFSMHRFDSGRSKFINYNAIVWISASILTLGIILVDRLAHFDYLNDKENNIYIPAVGRYACWINTNNWSAMLYFYTPLAILIVFNGVMFCLTTKNIYVENRGNQKVLNRSEQQRKSRNRANYRVYLRLFIVMGGSWFMEIIAFICERENVFETFRMIADTINSSQGMIIFLATFGNWDMIKSINRRIQNRESVSTDFSSGSRPQESERKVRK